MAGLAGRAAPAVLVERWVAGEVVMCGRGGRTGSDAKGAKAWWAVGSGVGSGQWILCAAAAKTVGPSSGEGLSSPPGPVGGDEASLRAGFPKAQLRRACRADQPVVRPLFRAGSTCRLAEVALLLAALGLCAAWIWGGGRGSGAGGAAGRVSAHSWPGAALLPCNGIMRKSRSTYQLESLWLGGRH